MRTIDYRLSTTDYLTSVDSPFLSGHAIARERRIHPSGILRREAAHLVERLEILRGQFDVTRFEIVLELFHVARAEDHARHGVLREDPRKRDLRHTRGLTLRDAGKHIQDVECPILVDG